MPRQGAADMEKGVLLANGRLIDPINKIDGTYNVLIENGIITKLSTEPITAPQAVLLDVAGKTIFPGFIDMHVHLREPGEEYKENIESGTKAAAAGGFTAVACMPNTKPVNDNESVTSYILRKAQNCASRVYPVGAISRGQKGETLAEIGEMRQAGIVAVSDDGRPVENSQLMRRAMEYCSNYNLSVICHSENMALSRSGVMNEGPLATKLGLRGIPRIAEEISIYRDISLAGYLGLAVHIAHISTKESVDLVRRAKSQGIQVTAETAPHYFSLSEEAVKLYNTNAKMNPPLRTSEDVNAIREGLVDGTIDVIATDHAPHSILEKDVEFDQAAFGIIGLETAVPLTLALVEHELITFQRMAELLSVTPAKILGVPGGELRQGVAADITVIDPDREFTYDEGAIVSKSKNSPFLGMTMKGKAVLTMVNGIVTYNDLHC